MQVDTTAVCLHSPRAERNPYLLDFSSLVALKQRLLSVCVCVCVCVFVGVSVRVGDNESLVVGVAMGEVCGWMVDGDEWRENAGRVKACSVGSEGD